MHNNCTIIDYLHTSIPIKASTFLHYYVQFSDLPILTLLITAYYLLMYFNYWGCYSSIWDFSSSFYCKILEAKFSEMILRPENKAQYLNENLQKEYQKSKKM